MFKDFSKGNTDKLGLIFLKGVIFGLITTLLLMMGFSALILALDIDRAYAQVLSTVSVAAGCFVASLYSAHKIGGRGYLVGLIIGVVTFSIITIISLIINKGGLTSNTLFRLAIVVLSSMIGGIVGVNRGKNKKYI